MTDFSRSYFVSKSSCKEIDTLQDSNKIYSRNPLLANISQGIAFHERSCKIFFKASKKNALLSNTVKKSCNIIVRNAFVFNQGIRSK